MTHQRQREGTPRPTPPLVGRTRTSYPLRQLAERTNDSVIKEQALKIAEQWRYMAGTWPLSKKSLGDRRSTGRPVGKPKPPIRIAPSGCAAGRRRHPTQGMGSPTADAVSLSARPRGVRRHFTRPIRRKGLGIGPEIAIADVREGVIPQRLRVAKLPPRSGL